MTIANLANNNPSSNKAQNLNDFTRIPTRRKAHNRSTSVLDEPSAKMCKLSENNAPFQYNPDSTRANFDFSNIPSFKAVSNQKENYLGSQLNSNGAEKGREEVMQMETDAINTMSPAFSSYRDNGKTVKPKRKVNASRIPVRKKAVHNTVVNNKVEEIDVGVRKMSFRVSFGRTTEIGMVPPKALLVVAPAKGVVSCKTPVKRPAFNSTAGLTTKKVDETKCYGEQFAIIGSNPRQGWVI